MHSSVRKFFKEFQLHRTVQKRFTKSEHTKNACLQIPHPLVYTSSCRSIFPCIHPFIRTLTGPSVCSSGHQFFHTFASRTLVDQQVNRTLTIPSVRSCGHQFFHTFASRTLVDQQVNSQFLLLDLSRVYSAIPQFTLLTVSLSR